MQNLISESVFTIFLNRLFYKLATFARKVFGYSGFLGIVNGLKCIRLFRPQFRKVKIRFVVEIP